MSAPTAEVPLAPFPFGASFEGRDTEMCHKKHRKTKDFWKDGISVIGRRKAGPCISDDEFNEHSSINEMFGGSTSSRYPSISSSSSEDNYIVRFPGLSSSGDHPATVSVPNRLSEISRLTDVDGAMEEV
jgi:hypothetical protein